MGAVGCTLNTPRDTALHPTSVPQHIRSGFRSALTWVKGSASPRKLGWVSPWGRHSSWEGLCPSACPPLLAHGACLLATLAFPQPALSACFFPTRLHGNYKDLGVGGGLWFMRLGGSGHRESLWTGCDHM